jgi:hypothetical protein
LPLEKSGWSLISSWLSATPLSQKETFGFRHASECTNGVDIEIFIKRRFYFGQAVFKTLIHLKNGGGTLLATAHCIDSR